MDWANLVEHLGIYNLQREGTLLHAFQLVARHNPLQVLIGVGYQQIKSVTLGYGPEFFAACRTQEAFEIGPSPVIILQRGELG